MREFVQGAVRGGRGYVAAVDIGGTNLRLIIADMTGAIVGKWSGSTVGASSPERVVRLIQSGVQNVVRRKGLRRDALLAIAAGAPGMTDSRSGVVRLTSYLGGWKDVPLGRLLEKALGVPAAIENDVRLGAVGETMAGIGARDWRFCFYRDWNGNRGGDFPERRIVARAGLRGG